MTPSDSRPASKSSSESMDDAQSALIFCQAFAESDLILIATVYVSEPATIALILPG
jgi:hypothetical protein